MHKSALLSLGFILLVGVCIWFFPWKNSKPKLVDRAPASPDAAMLVVHRKTSTGDERQYSLDCTGRKQCTLKLLVNGQIFLEARPTWKEWQEFFKQTARSEFMRASSRTVDAKADSIISWYFQLGSIIEEGSMAADKALHLPPTNWESTLFTSATNN